MLKLLDGKSWPGSHTLKVEWSVFNFHGSRPRGGIDHRERVLRDDFIAVVGLAASL
jgi:hypothetical protein